MDVSEEKPVMNDENTGDVKVAVAGQFPTNPKTGMPLIPKEEADKAYKKMYCYIPMNIGISMAIGIGIACLIHFLGSNDKYEKRLVQAHDNEMQWGFLAAFIFGMSVWILNVYPEFHKARIMVPGDLWSNVFIYRLAAEDPNESSCVVVNNEGDVGRYNRAHRGLYHFIENVLPVVFALPFTLYVYPFPSFVLTCIYCVGRIIYIHGYAVYFYNGRTPGYILERMSMCTILGLCLIAGIKSC